MRVYAFCFYSSRRKYIPWYLFESRRGKNRNKRQTHALHFLSNSKQGCHIKYGPIQNETNSNTITKCDKWRLYGHKIGNVYLQETIALESVSKALTCGQQQRHDGDQCEFWAHDDVNQLAVVVVGHQNTIIGKFWERRSGVITVVPGPIMGKIRRLAQNSCTKPIQSSPSPSQDVCQWHDADRDVGVSLRALIV